MKPPRVTDFDPTAKPKELGSPMDNFPLIQKPNMREERKSSPVPRTPVLDTAPRTVVPPYPRTVPPSRRKIKQRHPFDIYEDQYETLQQIAKEEKDQGLPGSMSAMVREGIDIVIAKKKKTPYPVL